jgi:NIMA (never in mitosis gene a)-related kinase
MKEKHIWKIVIQVVRGLQALHDLRILHRDMKSANIFLYLDGTAKLGDLNVSKVAKKRSFIHSDWYPILCQS